MVIDSKTSGIIVTVVLVIMACRVIYLNVKLAKLESYDLHVRLTEAICAANMELFATIYYFGNQLFKKAWDLSTASGIIFLALFLFPIAINMEQIIHTLSVLELIMLLPILLAGYRERKKYKNAEKLYELPALKIGQEIYQLKAGEARKASIKDIEITRERNITYHAETIKREAIYFSEEDIGKTIFKETGENHV